MDWKAFFQKALDKFLDFIFRRISFSMQLVKIGAGGLMMVLTPWWLVEGFLTKYGLIDPQPIWPQIVVATVFIVLLLIGINIYVWERLVGITHADSSLEAARIVLVTYLARSYSSLFNACNWVINLDDQKEATGEYRYECKVKCIVEAMKDLQRLKEKLSTDRSIPDAELSAKFTLFLDHVETAVKKLRFFCRTYRKSGMQQQLVGYSPVPNLYAIEEIVESLKHRYHSAFTGDGVVFSGILSAEGLSEVWEKAAKARGLCLNANEFEKIVGRHIVAFDKTVFSKLYGIQDGEVITLWDENEPL